MKSLIGAFIRENTTATSQTMIEDLYNWILVLRTKIMVNCQATGQKLYLLYNLDQVWDRPYYHNYTGLEGIF